MDQGVTNATAALASHALHLDTAALPDAVVRQSKVVLADTVAILLAASRERASRVALRSFPLTPCGTCTVVGHGRGATPEQAAFLNGVAGHDLELDDSHSPSRTHAAAVTVPAALAAAEARGGCAGADLLAGIVAGYDVQVRVSKAMGVQEQYDRGFHPTAVCGSVGAAVTAGRILGLPVAEMQSCVGLAASQSSGLLTWKDDPHHMVKSLDTGIAARNGLYAALLAARGFRGSPDVLTGRYQMLPAFGRAQPDHAQLLDGLGDRFDICETSIKRHACGGQDQAAIDALLTLQARHGIGWRDISAIDVQLAHDALPIVDGSLLMNVNIQFLMALAAHQGLILREYFTERWTQDPDITALARSVTVRGNDALSAAFPTKKGAIVTVETTRGRFTEACPAPRGNPDEPLTEQELWDKFLALATAVLDDEAARRLWEVVGRFETEPDTAELCLLLAGKG